MKSNWLLGAWSPDFSRSHWTLSLAAVTLVACVTQALVGWHVVMAAIGFVPSLVWMPSSWFSTLPGQSLPVFLTWITYVFPHMGWGHMTGNVLLLLMFGSVVEPMIGTRRYVALTVFGAVFGVFGLAAVHPRGTDAIAGGSLLLCTVFGVWLASISQAWTRKHSFWTAALEVAAIASLIAWLACRTPPSSPSPLLGVLWHVPSLMLGWFTFRFESDLFQRGVDRPAQQIR